MTQPAPVASLLDVDDTLLDNDGIVANLMRHLTRAFATEREDRYCSRPIRPEAPEPHQKLR
jgi:phosphoglycolate phosphatase-like HAD superfamily hydrolase